MNPGQADLNTGADLENADLGDFGDPGADDVGLQAALADEALVEADISDVAEVANLAAGDLGPGRENQRRPSRRPRRVRARPPPAEA